MKLRNKKTGAIYKIEDIDLGNNQDGIWLGMTTYSSLAELNEEWEDYEEPKESWWFIGEDATVYNEENDIIEETEGFKSIGNYFETKEEADKAVEKLKAWKWLKDNGVSLKYDKDKFILHIVVSGKISPNQWRTGGYMQKLDLLFGGEE